VDELVNRCNGLRGGLSTVDHLNKGAEFETL
jgi:hypothetical protein